jgi:uncharacterized OsmC-like protein
MTTTRNSTLNGIDVAALGETIEAVRQDPAKGMVSFGVTTAWKGGTRSETQVSSYTLGGETHPRNFTVQSDEPPELLGTNTNPNPQELLFAAMNACIMVGYVANAAAMGIALESVEIQSSGELDLRGFLAIDETVKPGYDAVHYTVRIRGDASPAQLEELHQHVSKTSVNRFNIASPITVTSDLVVS